MSARLLDNDIWVSEDDLEQSICRRIGLWLYCLIVIGTLIGGIVLILWTLHVV